jgi:hypothetical protein
MQSEACPGSRPCARRVRSRAERMRIVECMDVAGLTPEHVVEGRDRNLPCVLCR